MYNIGLPVHICTLYDVSLDAFRAEHWMGWKESLHKIVLYSSSYHAGYLQENDTETLCEKVLLENINAYHYH
jgi:hypothetical protein